MIKKIKKTNFCVKVLSFVMIILSLFIFKGISLNNDNIVHNDEDIVLKNNRYQTLENSEISKKANLKLLENGEKDWINGYRYLANPDGTNYTAWIPLWIEYCDPRGEGAYCYFNILDENGSEKVDKVLRNNLSDKYTVNNYRYLQQGAVADTEGTYVTCGASVYIEYCQFEGETEYCYFNDPDTKNIRRVYRNKLSTEAPNCMGALNAWRFMQEGAIADGGSNYECGVKVWIDSCELIDGTKYCYFSDPYTGEKRTVYGNRLTTSLESATATCSYERKVYEDRYVVGNSEHYKCGDKIRITICDGDKCTYEVNNKYGVVSDSKLRKSETVAKEDCGVDDISGYRYVGVAATGDPYKCSDRLYITECDENVCEYTSINDRSLNGRIKRINLRESKSNAENGCGVKGNRYIALDNNEFNCGDELYITGCTDTICDYNRINGEKKSGTVERNYLKESIEASKSDCEKVKNTDYGDKYSSTMGFNYKCGDKLYVTTCDEDSCNYTMVNDEKLEGYVERMSLKDDKETAKTECNKGIFYGNRYASTSGLNYRCGDKLFITSCDEDICLYTQVEGQEASGAIPRNYLTVAKSSSANSCSDKNDFGNRYPSTNGTNFVCGDALFITECDEKTCKYSSINGVSSAGTIDRMILKKDKADALNACDNTVEFDDMYVSVNGNDYTCGDILSISSCSLDVCNYTKVKTSDGVEKSAEGSINRDLLKETKALADAKCESTTVLENQKGCNNKTMSKMSGNSAYTLCYKNTLSLDKIKDELAKVYKCDTKNGYEFDKTAIAAVGKSTCNKHGYCSQTYTVNCSKGKNAKPVLSVTSGIAQSNGTGIITVNATANDGILDSYYVSDKYVAPTDSSRNWKKITNASFTIEGTPGVKYIWVRDSKGNISNAVSGAILDSKTLNTTLSKLELVDSTGKVQNANRVSHVSDIKKSSKYVLMSNDLIKDSKVLADGFNPFDMEYKLDVESPTLSVYATLTSTDSHYVEGFGPRTVNLEYGINTILIKIENNEGKVRTYTILATRVDDRTSDNTLSDLSVSEGNLTFNANVTDYKVEVSKDIKSVNVSAKIGSDKASYVSGYEPGEVKISGDTTVKLIKVKSETGSTRTYVITFVKKGTDIITDESLQLADFVIPGVNMAFEEDVANYSLSVEYEKENIDLNLVLKDEFSKVIVRTKRKNDSKFKESSKTGIGLDVGENFIEIEITNVNKEKSYYRLTIIRKEFGLEISDDTSLKDLKVLGYDIDFNPKVKDYTVRIKQEKSLVITAVPLSNRAEVFIRGNDELTGFSTVRVKVVAENGKFETYSIDIKKDAFNKIIEIGAIIVGAAVVIIGSIVIIKNKKSKTSRDYFEE